MPTTIQDVKKYTDSLNGVLISTTPNIINIKNTKLIFDCIECNIQYNTTFFLYRKSNSGICPSCRRISSGKQRKLDYNYIKNVVESKNVKLLSNEYKGHHHPLKIKCSCGNIYYQKYIIFHKNEGGKCKECLMNINWKLNILKKTVHKIEKEFNIKILTKYMNTRQYVDFRCTCGEVVKNRRFNNILYRKDVNCKKCTHSSSSFETEVKTFIQSILPTTEIIDNIRSIITPKELDIYIPSHNLAIECNGIYWHSELNGKDKKYHLTKTKLCEENGIQLIHIFENEWYEKKEIVKSIIKAKLGIITNKIYARKCYIEEIANNIKSVFMNENHLQGSDRSNIKIGLYYDDKLVSMMTFCKSRYNKNYEWELSRFCNMKNTIVMGGANKLLKYFINNYNPQSIITYADRRYSNGSLYTTLKFKLLHISNPNYFYFKHHTLTLYSRVKFQKHKLKIILKNFNPHITEWENMKINGYDRIWDCGNMVYEFKL